MEEEGPYQKLVHEEWSGLRGRVAGVVTGGAAVRVTRIVAAAARSMHRLRRRRSHILDAQRQDKAGQERTRKDRTGKRDVIHVI